MYLLGRAGSVPAVMLAVSVVLFLALEVNISNVARKVLGPYSSQEQRQLWLEENGYFDPIHLRYGRWLANFATGDWGMSTRFREPVIDIVLPRLANTAILAAITLVIVSVLSLFLGVLAGMREGSALDRAISLFGVITTSIPEFASVVFFSAILVYWLGVLPGSSPMLYGFSVREIILPVLVLSLFSLGYVTRMTRASMIEVMGAPYVRAAIIRGVPYYRVILFHALRNALITPVTVIMLLAPWLLSGVVVVEYAFGYKGFGSLLYEAALNDDLYLIEACAMISVGVVVLTQFLSDAAYRILNPRLRK